MFGGLRSSLWQSIADEFDPPEPETEPQPEKVPFTFNLICDGLACRTCGALSHCPDSLRWISSRSVEVQVPTADPKPEPELLWQVEPQNKKALGSNGPHSEHPGALQTASEKLAERNPRPLLQPKPEGVLVQFLIVPDLDPSLNPGQLSQKHFPPQAASAQPTEKGVRGCCVERVPKSCGNLNLNGKCFIQMRVLALITCSGGQTVSAWIRFLILNVLGKGPEPEPDVRMKHLSHGHCPDCWQSLQTSICKTFFTFSRIARLSAFLLLGLIVLCAPVCVCTFWVACSLPQVWSEEFIFWCMFMIVPLRLLMDVLPFHLCPHVCAHMTRMCSPMCTLMFVLRCVPLFFFGAHM